MPFLLHAQLDHLKRALGVAAHLLEMSCACAPCVLSHTSFSKHSLSGSPASRRWCSRFGKRSSRRRRPFPPTTRSSWTRRSSKRGPCRRRRSTHAADNLTLLFVVNCCSLHAQNKRAITAHRYFDARKSSDFANLPSPTTFSSKATQSGGAKQH